MRFGLFTGHRPGLRANVRARGMAAFRGFVARSDDHYLERTLGSRAGLRGLFGLMGATFVPGQGVSGELCCELRTACALRVWTLEITPERVRARPGRGVAPRLTVKLTVADFLRIAADDLDAGSALLAGRLDLEGDFAFATRLGEMAER